MQTKGLQKLINTVKDLDSSEYTADSWKALEDAVAAAKDVVAKADASQSEIDAAVNGIIEALGNLEYGVQTCTLRQRSKQQKQSLQMQITMNP